MTLFAQNMLAQARPPGITPVKLPRRQQYYSSPSDWRDMVLYFLLPDRFSDGQEESRQLLDRSNLQAARSLPGGAAWRWDRWAASGGRWQGGTLRGIISKLGYLQGLGINALWIGPIFKQRGHLDTYHGYGIQDFLDVDPHFGTRQDLVDLVTAAHNNQMRVILDVVFNHSGANWLYPADTSGGPFTPYYTTGRYPFGSWRGEQGQAIEAIRGDDDGAWPSELQDPDCYTRAGKGSLDARPEDLDNPAAEHKRSDFGDLRDFDLDYSLTRLIRCYQYWIAFTDCDGFRIDTLKHVTVEQTRNFCGAIKEFAANLNKSDFFLVGEIAGGDYNQHRYLDALERNLNAALDIGDMVPTMHGVAKGLVSPKQYFKGFLPASELGSHRNLGLHHVSILDDHDQITRGKEKIRFSVNAASDYQVVAGVALQLFTLGIPCIYYGTEQAFAGPEAAEQQWLPDWEKSDIYLREAMFGPEHPRQPGRAGLPSSPNNFDLNLPGFGPFGTAGHHCFAPHHPAYVRISSLIALRTQRPVLRYGRQYQRRISILGRPFDDDYPGGELVAWSRILDDEEAVCILNAHGTQNRGADIEVGAELNLPGSTLQVILNTAEVAAGREYAGPYPIGTTITVKRMGDGRAYVSVQNILPSEVLVLTNSP